jgi:ornithine--oxo-acid transaminase
MIAMTARRWLLCAPDHFDVQYAINPWMDTAVPVDALGARRQWDALRAALRRAGAEVELIDPAPGLPDMVFCANAGIVDGERFVLARMRHPERHGEAERFGAHLAAHGLSVEELPEGALQEGAGDALPFRGRLLAGYGPRSNVAGVLELARRVSVPVTPLRLEDERLYHLDLAFCPLDARTALVCFEAFDAESERALRALVPDPIALEEDETLAFTANSLVIAHPRSGERTVIMPSCSQRLRDALHARGFAVEVVDVGEFLKAGGGPRCLALALDERLDARLDGRPDERGEIEQAAPIALAAAGAGAEDHAALEARYGAHNYHPLPVTLVRADGAWAYDADGRAYLDALSAYSALNFGHRHPRLLAAARRQLERLTLTSRAFGNDQLGAFCRELAAFCGKDRVLPMNTGAEAVESAIKLARRWGYEVKGVAPEQARIVVCAGNFHGRTTTIVSFSDDPLARDGFGPYAPGFVTVPFGDAAALEAAIDERTVGFLFEPVQGEAGVIVPPAGWLRAVRRICDAHGILMIADEIQSGLGRTGRTFACEHEAVVPDLYVLGKALGGGIVPLSAVVGDEEVFGVLDPGRHGSTFGGNPVACAVGREVLRLLAPGRLQQRAATLGARIADALADAAPASLAGARVHGLWAGLDLRAEEPPARAWCEALLDAGVLAKDAHERTIRLAPPLVLTDAELEWLLERLLAVLGAGGVRAAA